jgi:hypothetical protein
MNLHDLFEGASSVLYHYTSARAALRILQSGQFELTSSVGNKEETRLAPPGYPYYLSTTRSKVGDYHARYPGSYAVMFNLDGTVLNQRNKVQPIDYWERMWLSDTSGTRTREAEDRVFSKNPTIPIKGVITEIHQLIADADDIRGPVIRQFAIAAKTQGIPIYFYKDTNSWLLQNPRGRVSLTDIKPSLAGPVLQRGYYHSSSRIRPLEQWIELIYKKNKNELSEEADRLRFDLVYYGSRYENEDQGLAIELHNARKPNEVERKYADKIIQYMRKNNIATTVELKNALVKKWSKESQ